MQSNQKHYNRENSIKFNVHGLVFEDSLICFPISLKMTWKVFWPAFSRKGIQRYRKVHKFMKYNTSFHIRFSNWCSLTNSNPTLYLGRNEAEQSVFYVLEKRCGSENEFFATSRSILFDEERSKKIHCYSGKFFSLKSTKSSLEYLLTLGFVSSLTDVLPKSYMLYTSRC